MPRAGCLLTLLLQHERPTTATADGCEPEQAASTKARVPVLGQPTKTFDAKRLTLMTGYSVMQLPGTTRLRGAARDTGAMVDEDARDRAIYQALKAVDEVAAALQTHLIEEHQADPERSSAQSTSTNSLKLLRQARERLGEGLRTIEADTIARSDEISLRRE
jgi:DNA-binding FrmR family transcriptional regulator